MAHLFCFGVCLRLFRNNIQMITRVMHLYKIADVHHPQWEVYLFLTRSSVYIFNYLPAGLITFVVFNYYSIHSCAVHIHLNQYAFSNPPPPTPRSRPRPRRNPLGARQQWLTSLAPPPSPPQPGRCKRYQPSRDRRQRRQRVWSHLTQW